MSADSGNETQSSPETRQVLAFLLVALIVGLPALWLGGPAVGYFAFLLFGLLFVLFFSGDRRRLYAIAYSFLAVCLLFGGLAYARLVSQDTAARIGSLPLIGGLLRLTAVRVGMAVLAGLTGGLLLVGLPLFLILFISAEWMLALREAYDLDRQLAMKLLLDLALGRSGPLVIADAGEIKSTDSGSQLDKFGAPVVVLVKPYNALVLERGGEVTRIEGAGMVKLQQHETVKAVVDLRPQGGKFELTALTKDNVPLTVSGSTSFRIESWQEARDRGDEGDLETRGFTGVISGPYPVYRRTLYRAIYGVGSGADWKSQSVGNARGKIGAAIRDLRLDEIFVVDEDERVSMERSVLQDIVDQAKPKAVKSGHSWGVTVKGVGIGSIEMPKEAQEEFLRRWGAPWRGWQVLREAEAESQVTTMQAESKSQALLAQERAKARAARWKVIEGALAKLKSAKAKGEAAVMSAEARAKSSELQQAADFDAYVRFIERLAGVLIDTVGPTAAREILRDVLMRELDLNQLRRLIAIVGPSSRALEGGVPRMWQIGLPGEESEETPQGPE